MIKTIVPEVYFQTLRNCHTGYVTVCSLYIFTHLHATYGMPEDDDIHAIDTALKAPINVETHFENFVAQIEKQSRSGDHTKPVHN